jgi:monoamine oxidase
MIQKKLNSLSNQEDVIVIGAGIAGIESARFLQSQGYSVLVLEARDRIGGRVLTNNSLDNIPLDLGASWVHGVRNNPVTALIRQFQIKILQTDYNSFIQYNSNGNKVTDFQERELEKLFDILVEKIEAFRTNLKSQNQPDISLQQALKEIIINKRFTSQEIVRLNYIVNTFIEHDHAADINNLSLFNFDQTKEFKGGDVIFPEGYQQITDKLAKGLIIKLGQIVQRIDYSSSKIKITTNKKMFVADRVIITVPLGVLKSGSIKFYPNLPLNKQVAINRLDMGLFNKVYLYFPQIFWDKKHDIFRYISSKKGEWSEWLNFYKYIRKPVLVGFNAGVYAMDLESLNDMEIIQEAMRVLRTIYGKNIPNPINYLITRWQSDPFSRGSYSCLPPGASILDRQILSEPIANKLFFAGEATSKDFAATVHGALLSGRQAARQIVNLGNSGEFSLDMENNSKFFVSDSVASSCS